MAILDDILLRGFITPSVGIQPGGVLNQFDDTAPAPGMGINFGASPTPQRAALEQANPQTRGILDKISAVPGLSDGLIGAGVGLLSSNNLREGLAAGFQGFNTGMNSAGKSKMVQIPGTPYFMTTTRDGRQQIVDSQGNPIRTGADGTDPLKQYMIEAEQRKNDFGIQKIQTQAQAGVDAAGAKGAQKTAEEVRPILNDVTGLKDRWTKAYDIVAPIQVDENKNPILDEKGQPVRGSQGTGAQLQGMFPGVAGFFGMDEASKNKVLQGLTVDETLLNTARTKGAISNQEMMLFKSPIPALTDDRKEVWKPWIEQRIAVLNKLEQFYQGEITRGTNPTVGGSNPQVGGGNKPKTSGGVTQVTSESEWQALPAGTMYKDPDGVIRTKR